MFSAQPSLELRLNSNIYFLHPTANPDSEPSEDPIVHGLLRLSLPVRREIKSLTVRLEGCYSLAIPFHPLESGKLLSNQVTIDTRGTYDKGDHLFEFSLVIPSSTPPYHRSRYGRIYHRVVAVAKGAGLFGGDLSAEQSPDIVVNPAPEGEVAGIDLRIEGYEAALGPYVVALRSPHLTVGGLLRASLYLSDPPPEIKVHAFSVFVIQKATLRSRVDPSLVCETDPQRHVLFRLDKLYSNNSSSKSNLLNNGNGAKNKHRERDSSRESSLASALGVLTPPSSPPPSDSSNKFTPYPFTTLHSSSGNAVGDTLFHSTEWGALSTSRVVRFPADSTLRPSTHPGTKGSPIENTHEIEVRFRYELPGLGRRVFTVAREVELSSCCCRIESIILPSYEDSKADTTVPASAKPTARPMALSDAYHPQVPHNKTDNPCVCGASAEYLLYETNAAKTLLEELAVELEKELQPPARTNKSALSTWAAAAAASGNPPSLDTEMGMAMEHESDAAAQASSSSTRPPNRTRSFPAF